MFVGENQMLVGGKLGSFGEKLMFIDGNLMFVGVKQMFVDVFDNVYRPLP